METAQQLREKIAALLNRSDAIVSICREEKREPNTEELAEIDAIHGKGTKGESGFVPGKLDDLEEKLKRAVKIETRQAQFAAASVNGGIRPMQDNGGVDGDGPRAANIVIPVQHRVRYGQLKAFTGEHAEQKAYLAGRFYAAAIFSHRASMEWCRDQGFSVQASQRGSINELGGFLIPSEVEQVIIDLREKYGVFRQHCRVTPMAGDEKSVPRALGGVVAHFISEATAGDEQETKYDNVLLKAKKIYALLKYSMEVSDDAFISIGDELTKEIAWAFAKLEDECGFIGNGASTYGGIVGVVNAVLAGSIVDAASSHTSFESLTLGDFEGCIGKLPEYAQTNAKWFISMVGYAASMQRLINAAGGNTITTLSEGQRVREFLGFPVVVTQVLNKTLGANASQPACIFGDLSMAATLGDRRGMEVRSDASVYFKEDCIAVKGTQRFDINVHERGTATEAGAVIVLKKAAS